jgi:hypothetical protein
LAEAGRRFDRANNDLDKVVQAAIKGSTLSDVELLRAHYCEINGRAFAHVVLQRGSETISVLMTDREPEISSGTSNAHDCDLGGSFSVACFETDEQIVFVVSSLSPQVNTTFAAAIEEPVRVHIRRSGTNV